MPQLLEWLCANEPDFRKNRLPSLFSDLIQQKTANPDGFVANCRAWQKGLSHAALAGQLPTEQKLILHTSADLLDQLTDPTFGRPSGLGSVFDDGVQAGRMIDLSDFESAQKSICHKSWVPSPWTVLKWGLKQTGLAGGRSYDYAGDLRTGDLVMLEALEQIAKQVRAWQSSRSQSLSDRVMTKNEFAAEVGKISVKGLSARDLNVLLRYLERDKFMLCFENDVVKLNPASATSIPEPITTEDRTIVGLKSLIDSITQQTKTLAARIADLQLKARTSVAAKNKTTALAALRSKKQAETTLQARTDTLHQLETVFAKIQEAQDQIQVVQVMQQSTQVLRKLNQQIGGADRVDDIVDELREQMSQVDEVGHILNEPLNADHDILDAEVDQELEDMELQELRSKEKAESLAETTSEQLKELNNFEAEKRGKSDGMVQDPQGGSTFDQELRHSTERLEKMQISIPDS